MVTVVSRKKGKQFYYYLRHTTGTKQAEEYLGKEIPPDIEQRKARFVLDFYRKDWIPKLEAIKKGFVENNKKIPKSLIEEQLNEFSIVFTYHTNRIEGSALSLQDTFDLIQRGLTPAKKPQSDTIETQMHRRVFLDVIRDKKPLTLCTVLNWHKEIFEKSKPEHAGMLRNHNVMVTNSKSSFPLPDEVPQQIKEFFKWYHKEKSKINPVELASLAHLKFVSIHPFGDGNGRISRLMMNHVLASFDYPLFIIEYEGRLAYYLALERSQTEYTDMPFLQWFMKRYIAQHYKHYVK